MARNCKFCGLPGHTTLTCYARPKNRILTKKKIKQIGKVGQRWFKVRAEWFEFNTGPWFCYYCGEQLAFSEVQLDHKLSRARHPELRFELSNLVPSCARDNANKGSLDADEYLAKLGRLE